jgi:hypothetical protein
MHWIRQRHELLARHAAPETRNPRSGLGRAYVPQQDVFCTIVPTSKTIGYGLRLLGERDVPEVRLVVQTDERFQSDEIERAARLFPEAKILVFRGGWKVRGPNL